MLITLQSVFIGLAALRLVLSVFSRHTLNQSGSKALKTDHVLIHSFSRAQRWLRLLSLSRCAQRKMLLLVNKNARLTFF